MFKAEEDEPAWTAGGETKPELDSRATGVSGEPASPPPPNPSDVDPPPPLPPVVLGVWFWLSSSSSRVGEGFLKTKDIRGRVVAKGGGWWPSLEA